MTAAFKNHCTGNNIKVTDIILNVVLIFLRRGELLGFPSFSLILPRRKANAEKPT